MVFPIAVGTGPRHSSSRPFPHAPPRGNTSNNDGGVEMHDDDAVVLAMGTNDDETLTATVFISYHFLSAPTDATKRGDSDAGDNDAEIEATIPTGGESCDHYLPQHFPSSKSQTRFHVIAELRVQIMPTASPFVSNVDAMSGRETKSRVPLGIMRRRRSHSTDAHAYAPIASIEFSSNETQLACLVPSPRNFELISPSESSHDTFASRGNNNVPTSTIVIFRIRATIISPQQHSQQRKKNIFPKLPEYITERVADEEAAKERLEKDNIHGAERDENLSMNDMELQEEPPGSSATTSSTRRNSVSYVAHEPKIVRVPQRLNQSENEASRNRSFLRKISGGGIARSPPVQVPSLQCATCMCNVPSALYHGKSSSEFSLLLVGTTDGTLLIIDYSMARVRSVALESVTVDRLGENHGGILDSQIEQSNVARNQNHTEQQTVFDGHGYCINPIIHISQCTPTQWKPLDIYGEEQGSESKGRVATVLRDGSVNIYTTSFVASSDGSDRSNNIDRAHGNRINENNPSGLDMIINLLFTFRASKPGLDVPSLRYMRAKWLNPLLLVLLTRSPYLDEFIIFGQIKHSTVLQLGMIVAQVWTVAEVLDQNQDERKGSSGQAKGWTASSDFGASISLVSELKMPYDIEDLVHDTFSLSQEDMRVLDEDIAVNTSFKKPSRLLFSDCARGMMILYHRGTDTVSVNSQIINYTTDSTGGISLKARPVCLIWDWKRNVPGLTLASSTPYCLYHHRQDVPPLYSWLQLGVDDDHGLCAVHVYEQTLPRKRRRAGKDIFVLSILSPLNRLASEGYLSLNEPSAILLHRDSVTFPLLGQPSTTIDVPLQWEESRVPHTYVATNGPCQIATIGKDYARCIAVAASRGLCILDLSRLAHQERQPDPTFLSHQILSQCPRWKLFSNVNDEQCFRISSMIWWELTDEDLLLAVVQYTNIDTLHLVCWSRKSLGFGDNQLLQESNTHRDEGDNFCDHGIALPPRFHVHSMSIIKDPAGSPSSSQSISSNRALLLLSYISYREGGSCMDYALYQLQAVQSNGKYELVLARDSASGRIPLQLGRSHDLSATESVTGVFLAGGSFLFDLDKDAEDSASHETVAVIGVVAIFQGLIGICVDRTGPIIYRPSLLENVYNSIDDCHQGHRKSIIVAFWVSGNFSSRHDCRVAWSIAKNDGKVYCWSVPCTNAECRHRSIVEPSGEKWSQILPGLEKHSFLGEICHLGHSSLWMNGATTSEREVSIGPLPFGSTLYAGQRSRKNASLSNPVPMNSFHVSDCIIAPPQLTPFLLISFMNLLSSNDHEFEWQLVNRSGQDTFSNLTNGSHHQLERDHIKCALNQMKGLGSSSSALRIITMKVIEMLNDSKAAGKSCVGWQDNISGDSLLRSQKWAVGKAILSEVVSVAKEMYDTLGFANFFLSIGRQLEPHQYNLIFPLPVESPEPNSNPLRTAEDLFSLSCENGSLATALSSLPLFSCHDESQQSVTKLIYHCLVKIEENFQSCSSDTALTSAEDETFLHQLYWFGVKLEDAIEIEKSYREEEAESLSTAEYNEGEILFGSSHGSMSSSSTESSEESFIDQDTDEFVSVSSSIELDTEDYTLDTLSSEGSRPVSFLSPCLTPKTNRKSRVGLVRKVVKKLFPPARPPANSMEEGEENAIHEAASSFIFSGFDGSPIKSSPCKPPLQQEHNVESELEPADDKQTNSEDTSSCELLVPTTVAGSICIFINHVIALGAACEKDAMPLYGWKAVSTVAHLLQGERETMAITAAGSSNAQSVSRKLTSHDFIAATTIDEHLVTTDDDSYSTMAIVWAKLTSSCQEQIHSQALSTVFNLVLLLLLRHNTCEDVQQCTVTLISVGIVTGHLSGRINELLDFSEMSCDVNTIYSLYAAQLDS